jgi:hypothetical protein
VPQVCQVVCQIVGRNSTVQEITWPRWDHSVALETQRPDNRKAPFRLEEGQVSVGSYGAKKRLRLRFAFQCPLMIRCPGNPVRSTVQAPRFGLEPRRELQQAQWGLRSPPPHCFPSNRSLRRETARRCGDRSSLRWSHRR